MYSRNVPFPNPRHRSLVDIRVHREEVDVDEEEEEYLEQLSLIKFPATTEIVGPLDFKADFGGKGAFHFSTNNQGADTKQEGVTPTSSAFGQNEGQTDEQINDVFRAGYFRIGTGLKLPEVKVPKDPNEEHDRLTQEILQCKDVLAKKEIADPEDIRRATFLLHQASVRLSKLGYKRTPSEREGSSSSCSSLSDHSEVPGKESKDVKKRN